MDSDLVSSNTSSEKYCVTNQAPASLFLTPIILKTRIITLPAGAFIVYSRFPAIRETENKETNHCKGNTENRLVRE